MIRGHSMREELKAEVRRSKVVAILRGIEGEKLLPTAQALFQGGVRLLEVTFPQIAPDQFQNIAWQIDRLRARFDGEMFIGAGTVTTPELVELTASAGGQFIVSPDTQQSVIERTREQGLVSMPGAMTATEILTAHRWGADFVKLFPAGALGSGYLKAVRAPVSHVELLAVGGINAENAGTFIHAGATGVGVGGELVDKTAIANGRYEEIVRRAEALLAAVQG